MLRRLFFLFPDEKKARAVVDELQDRNIPERRIHAIVPGVESTILPEATPRQKRDTGFMLERCLWCADLLVFFIALIMLVVGSVLPNAMLFVGSLVVMLLTFLIGEYFVVNVPDVHLTEFTDALSHGEVLLMVDVPMSRVSEVEEFVHRKHPEAVVGGVGWTIEALGI